MTTTPTRRPSWLHRHLFGLLAAALVIAVLVGCIGYATMHEAIMVGYINPALWIVSNLILVYTSGALVLWVILYGTRFKWNTTPAGTDVFWFTLALLGLVVLSFIGIFVNGRQNWYEAPPDLLVWRPFVRYLVYTGIAITLTRLDWSLIQRLRGRQPLMFEVIPRDRDTTPR